MKPESQLWKFYLTLAIVVLVILTWSNFDMRSSLSKERKAKVKVTKELKTTKKELKVAVDELQMYKDGFENWMKRAKEVDKLQRENNEKQEELNDKLEKLISQKTEQRRIRVASVKVGKQSTMLQQSSNHDNGERSGGGDSGQQGQYLGEFESTAYNGAEFGSSGVTASGTRVGIGTIAVDRWVIPMGTNLYIEGYGNGTALDTGGAIKGNKIDVWFDSVVKCNQFGRRTVRVWLR